MSDRKWTPEEQKAIDYYADTHLDWYKEDNPDAGRFDQRYARKQYVKEAEVKMGNPVFREIMLRDSSNGWSDADKVLIDFYVDTQMRGYMAQKPNASETELATVRRAYLQMGKETMLNPEKREQWLLKRTEEEAQKIAAQDGNIRVEVLRRRQNQYE